LGDTPRTWGKEPRTTGQARQPPREGKQKIFCPFALLSVADPVLLAEDLNGPFACGDRGVTCKRWTAKKKKKKKKVAIGGSRFHQQEVMDTLWRGGAATGCATAVQPVTRKT
jgi:hypothetical protein